MTSSEEEKEALRVWREKWKADSDAREAQLAEEQAAAHKARQDAQNEKDFNSRRKTKAYKEEKKKK